MPPWEKPMALKPFLKFSSLLIMSQATLICWRKLCNSHALLLNMCQAYLLKWMHCNTSQTIRLFIISDLNRSDVNIASKMSLNDSRVCFKLSATTRFTFVIITKAFKIIKLLIAINFSVTLPAECQYRIGRYLWQTMELKKLDTIKKCKVLDCIFLRQLWFTQCLNKNWFQWKKNSPKNKEVLRKSTALIAECTFFCVNLRLQIFS